MAKVEMRIKPEVKLPNDVIVSIRTQGIIGDKYIKIKPGEYSPSEYRFLAHVIALGFGPPQKPQAQRLRPQRAALKVTGS
ncbi:MAG: MCE family protein, partial [Deltaproteobacteria bacterium]|nr:MCE family protein [Deltaproteobacteria bacterium]